MPTGRTTVVDTPWAEPDVAKMVTDRLVVMLV